MTEIWIFIVSCCTSLAGCCISGCEHIVYIKAASMMATAGSTDEPELCQNLDKHVLILSSLCAAVFTDTAEFT